MISQSSSSSDDDAKVKGRRRSSDLSDLQKTDEDVTITITPRESPRASYLQKLGVVGQVAQSGTVYQPREKRPPQHCTLIIFDWDDTLFCTSAIQSSRPPAEEKLSAIESEAASLLAEAKKLGTVMIITNASGGWVEQSCQQYLPKLATCIADIDIISARDKFEDAYPGDPTKWKIEAFCQVKENSKAIANLIALGDSSAEMTAITEMAKLYHISYTKTIKFKERPTCSELQKELNQVNRKLPQIVQAAKNYSIRMERMQTSARDKTVS